MRYKHSLVEGFQDNTEWRSLLFGWTRRIARSNEESKPVGDMGHVLLILKLGSDFVFSFFNLNEFKAKYSRFETDCVDF